MNFVRILLVAVAALTIGCSSAPKASEAPPAPSANTKKYQMHGKVLSVNAQDKSAKIDAGEIQGWMSAMTMDYPVRDAAEIAKLKEGLQIEATVFVDGDNFWIADVKEAAAPAAPPADGKK